MTSEYSCYSVDYFALDGIVILTLDREFGCGPEQGAMEGEA